MSTYMPNIMTINSHRIVLEATAMLFFTIWKLKHLASKEWCGNDPPAQHLPVHL